MKPLRRSVDARVPVDMTPMIDVVFQLLAFFMMSLRMVDVEGDFQIKMPVLSSTPRTESTLPPLRLQLSAGNNGELAQIRLNNQPCASLADVRQRITAILIDLSPTERKTIEIELACDFNLHYDHTMAAVTAVSGERLPSGKINRGIEKIRFAPR